MNDTQKNSKVDTKKPSRNLIREEAYRPSVDAYVTNIEMMDANNRRFALRSLIVITQATVIATIIILFLQGFHISGFQLPEDIIKWLISSTLAEVVIILGVIMKGMF